MPDAACGDAVASGKVACLPPHSVRALSERATAARRYAWNRHVCRRTRRTRHGPTATDPRAACCVAVYIKNSKMLAPSSAQALSAALCLMPVLSCRPLPFVRSPFKKQPRSDARLKWSVGQQLPTLAPPRAVISTGCSLLQASCCC